MGTTSEVAPVRVLYTTIEHKYRSRIHMQKRLETN